MFQGWDFSVEDKSRSEQSKKFRQRIRDKELLEEDQSQTQEQLAESLGVTQQAVSVRLRAMEMIQKQGNWVPYDDAYWNRETLKGDFSLANSWFKHNREKVFCGLWLETRSGIFYNKKKKYYAKPGQSLPSTSTSTPRSNIHNSKIMLCIWWDQKGPVYWAAEMTIPLRAIGIGYNWFVWAVHCEKNGRNTSINMIKLFFFMTMLGLMSLKS